MKVVMEARALASGSGGVRQYVRALAREMAQQPGVELELLTTDTVKDEDLRALRQQVVPLGAEWQLPMWLQWQVPRALEGNGADLVHFTKVDVPLKLDRPLVSTIYDVIPLLLPETQSFLRRYYWPGALRRAVGQSRHIFTISEASKQQLVQRMNADPDKITVTPLAVDGEHFYQREEVEIAAMRGRREIPGPYVLFVGTRDKRKNVWALLRAWRELAREVPHTLVLVGKPAELRDEAEELVERWGLGDRVQFWQDVSYDELPAVYSGAEMLVWPSIVEGWGLPPQEAMACGTPVIVSDGEPLSEVVGDAGEVVLLGIDRLEDAFQNEDFARRLGERVLMVLHDAARQQAMKKAGLEQAQKNSWEEVARLTVEGYKQALL